MARASTLREGKHIDSVGLHPGRAPRFGPGFPSNCLTPGSFDSGRNGTLWHPPYHSPMRRGLYFVLMMVLVLRGLAGTAMAAGVLPQLSAYGPAEQQWGPQGQQAHADHHNNAAHTEADAANWTGAADPEHASHHGLQAATAACDDPATGCTGHDHHSSACSACEICHSAMLDAPPQSALAPSTPGSLLALFAAPFDSAPAALAIKPPIA